MNRRILKLSFAAIICYCLLSYCVPNWDKKVKLPTNSRELQKEIERHVHIGMSTRTAKQILEDSGFICKYNKNASYTMYKKDINGNKIMSDSILKSITLIDGNYYSCYVHKNYIIGTTSWVVDILEKEGSITLIDAMVGGQNL